MGAAVVGAIGRGLDHNHLRSRPEALWDLAVGRLPRPAGAETGRVSGARRVATVGAVEVDVAVAGAGRASGQLGKGRSVNHGGLSHAALRLQPWLWPETLEPGRVFRVDRAGGGAAAAGLGDLAGMVRGA